MRSDRRVRKEARRRVWRLARATVKRHRAGVAGAIGLSFLLSFMPTIKSELESAIIDRIDQGLQGGRDATVADAFNEHVHSIGSDDAGGVESVIRAISNLLFDDVPLWRALLVYGGIVLVAYVLTVMNTNLRARMTRSFYTSLRKIGVRKALNFEPIGGAEDANRPGRQASAIQIGSSNVASGYSSWLEGGQHVFAIVTTLVLVAGKSLVFAASILFFIALQLLVTWWQGRALRADREEYDAKRNDLVGRSQDIIGKRDVVLAHERGEHYETVLENIAEQYGGLEQRLNRREETYRGLVSIVADSGRVVILGVALLIAVTSGTDAISGIGDAYFLIAIYFRLLSPAQSLMSNYAQIRRSQATSRELLELLSEPDERPPAEGEAEPPAQAPEEAVVFRHVRFAYPGTADDENDLADTSFRLLAGRTNLLVGRSGVGKTTIARIVLGFLRPEAGEVVVEGRPLEEWTPEALRLRMSYMPQSNQIVDDTVRANFFDDEAADDQLVALLRRVGLPSAAATDGQIHELLGERALELSGGQQQRLALARLLLDDAPIVILDEPLAGVDAFTFRDLADDLRKFLGESGKTVILISHRLAFAAYADHVVVLGDHGCVLEEGSREALVARGDVFHDLYLSALMELIPDANESDLRRQGPRSVSLR